MTARIGPILIIIILTRAAGAANDTVSQSNPRFITTAPIVDAPQIDPIEQKCAKVKVLNKATTCKSLKVEFDTSQCQFPKKSYEAWIACRRDGSAIARGLVPTGRLRAYLHRQKEDPGGIVWETDGSVMLENINAANDTSKGGDIVTLSKSAQAIIEPLPVAENNSIATLAEPPVPLPIPPPAEPKKETAEKAAETPSAANTMAVRPLLNDGNLKLSGYFDAYYAVNFNNPKPNSGNATTIANPQNNLQFYNWYANQFGLSVAELTINYSRNETHFLLDLDFGQMADEDAVATTSTIPGGPNAGAEDPSKNIGQAVLRYAPINIPGLIVEAGKMPTHIGLEQKKPKDNWNYSRSSLYAFGGPFWHTGLHVGYELLPGLSASVFVYNGWNTTYAVNDVLTFGGQLKWKAQSFYLTYNYLGGPEQPQDDTDWKQLHEVNFVYLLTNNLTLAADALSGTETNFAQSGIFASWQVYELLAKYQWTQRYYIAPRFEQYWDSAGDTLSGGGSQALMSFTLTQSYQLSEGLETRAEVRGDYSTLQNRFAGASGPQSQQWLGLVSVLYTL